MTAYVTALPEDPDSDWRIHLDANPSLQLSLDLTNEEMLEVIKGFYDNQDVSEMCPACGLDPMRGNDI